MKRAAANPAWSFSFQSENYSLATCWEKEKKISLLCAQFFFLLSAGWEVVNFIGIVRDKGVLVVKLQFVLFRGWGRENTLRMDHVGRLQFAIVSTPWEARAVLWIKGESFDL